MTKLCSIKGGNAAARRREISLLNLTRFREYRNERVNSTSWYVILWPAPGQTGLTDSFYATVRAFSSIHAQDLIRKDARGGNGPRKPLGLCKKLMTSR